MSTTIYFCAAWCTRPGFCVLLRLIDLQDWFSLRLSGDWLGVFKGGFLMRGTVFKARSSKPIDPVLLKFVSNNFKETPRPSKELSVVIIVVVQSFRKSYFQFLWSIKPNEVLELQGILLCTFLDPSN